jgi:purine-binding chemotaxis protein CheW
MNSLRMSFADPQDLDFRRTAPALAEKTGDSHLLCVLDGVVLGVEALAVREVLPLPLITPLREAPPQVAGIVNVRGSLVPVVDVRAVLGIALHAARTSDVLVVLERAGEFAAIIVSEVRDVRPLSARAIENGPMTMASGTGLVMGLAPLGDEIVQLLRLETLLHLGQMPIGSMPVSPMPPGQLPPGDATADLLFGMSDAAVPVLARALFEAVPAEQLETFAARARVLSRNVAGDIEVRDFQTRLVAAFAMGGEYFGLDLSVVREFSPLRLVAPVPCSPPYIAGLMNLRGETLTLIDIGPTLGLSPAVMGAESAKVVVTQCEGLRLGIIVEEVLDIISVNSDQIAPAAHSVGKGEAEMVGGTVFFRDKMLGIIDLPRLLSSDALGANI